MGLLAVLRGFTTSPLLPRYVSTFFHLTLFSAFALIYLRTLRKRPSLRVQFLALSLLVLLALPSAVRWLDDGMETSMVLCLVLTVAWFTHRLSLQPSITPADYLAGLTLGFLLVLLRNELAIVALSASATLCLTAAGTSTAGWPARMLRVIPSRSSVFLGALVAALAIRLVMHSFLPDTALAKSHGFSNSIGSLFASAEVILGALLFGLGTLALWLLSAAALFNELRARRLPVLPTLAANALFPTVVLLSSYRGQEVQGFRYLVWTLFFPILWNLLEIRRFDASTVARSPRQYLVFAAFLTVCLLGLPTESRLMYRVLTTRARTMRLFMGQHLDTALAGKLGMAIDVGYISYFTGDPICDAAGLVNGRAAAALSGPRRIQRCAAQNPDFALVNADQAGTIGKFFDFSGWRVCGQYDFGNMHQPDRHYLLVRPELAVATCAATGFASTPASQAFRNSGY